MKGHPHMLDIFNWEALRIVAAIVLLPLLVALLIGMNTKPR